MLSALSRRLAPAWPDQAAAVEEDEEEEEEAVPERPKSPLAGLFGFGAQPVTRGAAAASRGRSSDGSQLAGSSDGSQPRQQQRCSARACCCRPGGC